MSRKNVKPKYRKPVAAAPQPVAKEMAWQRHLPLIMVAVLFLLLALLYHPIAFGGKAPVASDITQWQGAAKSIIDYNKEHSDRALWTQSMFSGMPSYMISFPNRIPFFDTVINFVGKVMNWRILLLFLGGLGMFLLMRFWKMDPWISLIAAVAFVFSCHWVALLEIGHNTKFRAIMFIPWILWAMFYLREKPGLLGLGFLASTLIVQLRENHPQISYYLYLFIGMYWIWQLVESLIQKDHKRFWLFTLLLALAFGITALAVMNPYLSNLEYSHYTMRGGPGGLDTAYAQGWSFHPWEVFSLIIPNLFGGINQTYWGYMPFTQVYNYFGFLVLVLGLVALSTPKHRRLAIFLWITSVLFTIMSFGSFAPIISGLLLKYLPYFNKFRVPSMILTMVQINAVLLAGLGLDALKEKAEAKEAAYTKRLFIWFWVLGGIFLIWLTLAKALLGGMPFTNAAEIAQYQNAGRSIPADLIATRLDMMYKSGIISLLIATVGMGLAYLRQIGKLKNLAFSLLILVAVFLDLWIYTGGHLKDLQPVKIYENRFEAADYEQVMVDDTAPHRVYPIGRSLFDGSGLPKPTGEWAYHHDLINGYSAAKLKRYDDFMKLIDGDAEKQRMGEFQRYLVGIYGAEDGDPKELSMPVLNMLNTKYFIHPGALPMDSLLTKVRYASSSIDEDVVVYENLGALPRAWFVDEVRHVTEAESILDLMAEESFDPRRMAYVESPIEGVGKPENAQVKQTKAELHELEYNVSTDEDAFLVLSEVYYPAGWSATLDGKELPIYPVNYVLRGLKIPKGEHQLKLVFAPASYKRGITLSLIGILLALIALVGGLVLKYVKRPQPEQIIS